MSASWYSPEEWCAAELQLEGTLGDNWREFANHGSWSHKVLATKIAKLEDDAWHSNCVSVNRWLARVVTVTRNPEVLRRISVPEKYREQLDCQLGVDCYQLDEDEEEV
jgi:hypothetical protein